MRPFGLPSQNFVVIAHFVGEIALVSVVDLINYSFAGGEDVCWQQDTDLEIGRYGTAACHLALVACDRQVVSKQLCASTAWEYLLAH